ncbi:myo-inositol-1-phosphate synthase [Carpediemonas membranifera]|uniref:Inositol-3-phosphate synthase n=1 Tax=Carpediemonas membranifera TaxID=201153 RepID=A0A8J6AYV6_9EUKA|nr:myo-inositol-1-phosphate synthase [Carpediemonas membranifera]|eukprot:KAG9397408.1 myo-inositol-1-phosphate synthase [Carpediemonas membranifera]
MLVDTFSVAGKADTTDYKTSKFVYNNTEVEMKDGHAVVTPTRKELEIRISQHAPKTGLMLVGFGGSNGSTLLGGLLANQHNISWERKDGVCNPNFFGSMIESSTVRLGTTHAGEDVYAPFRSLVPFVDPKNPDQFMLGGWDINNDNMYAAMQKAAVLDVTLQHKLRPYMENITPMPSVFDINFVAANQEDRANNVITAEYAKEMLGEEVDTTGRRWYVEVIKAQMRKFKEENNLEKIVVLWTANTECFAPIIEGVNTTEAELLASLKDAEKSKHIAPSSLFAIAAIEEKVTFINGSPQNTLVPGVIEYAVRNRSMIGGDDFKSGQTKMKSVLTDFLVSSGIKPTCIASYNHLGNNDGLNLSSPAQFRSKEITKANVVDDIVASNDILYKRPGEIEKPDHCIVIKYLKYVGDSKRAMDEYTSEIFMRGKNTIVLHNTCEDSLLAAPIIMDMALCGEMLGRLQIREPNGEWENFHPVMNTISFFCKAPRVPDQTPIINALPAQRACLENILRCVAGLPIETNMRLENRVMPMMRERGSLQE